MGKSFVQSVWHEDKRNSEDRILSDFFNGFRLWLTKYRKGYKFMISVRRREEHGFTDGLCPSVNVAYFKDIDLEQAKIKAIEHFEWMIQ